MQAQPSEPERSDQGETLGLARVAGRVTGLGLGLAGAALRSIDEALDPPAEEGAPEGGAGEPSLGSLLPGAVMGLGIAAERRLLELVDALDARVVAPAAAMVSRPPPVRWVLDAARSRLREWDRRGAAERRRREEAAAELARQLAARVVDEVAEDVDVNRVADRVDVQRVLDRLDLPAITDQVMDDVHFGDIVRESAGAMTAETVDALRVQGMNADQLVERVVDRILGRKNGRRLEVAPDPEER